MPRLRAKFSVIGRVISPQGCIRHPLATNYDTGMQRWAAPQIFHFYAEEEVATSHPS